MYLSNPLNMRVNNHNSNEEKGTPAIKKYYKKVKIKCRTIVDIKNKRVKERELSNWFLIRSLKK